MSHRTLLINAVLAAGASLAGLAQADIVAVDSGIAVRASEGIAPGRGMTMTQVSAKFGAPVSKIPPVGKPPISRWEYPGFVVYFEHDYVIHSVISEAAPPDSTLQPPPAEAPATSQSRAVTSSTPPPSPAAEPAPGPAAERNANPAAPQAAEAAPPEAAPPEAVPPAMAEPVEPPPAP